MNELKIYSYNAFEIIKRDGLYYARYDAGSHQEAWREDEITDQEVDLIMSGNDGLYKVLLALETRIRLLGIDPHTSNWVPVNVVGN